MIDARDYTPQQRQEAAEMLNALLAALPKNRSKGDAQARADVAALAAQISNR